MFNHGTRPMHVTFCLRQRFHRFPRNVETGHRESSCQRDSVEQIETNAEQRAMLVSIQIAHPLKQIQSIPVSKYLPSNVRGCVRVRVGIRVNLMDTSSMQTHTQINRLGRQYIYTLLIL